MSAETVWTRPPKSRGSRDCVGVTGTCCDNFVSGPFNYDKAPTFSHKAIVLGGGLPTCGPQFCGSLRSFPQHTRIERALRAHWGGRYKMPISCIT